MSEDEFGEVLKASAPGADQITAGMDVLGVDGEVVGQVKEVRENDFLLDRPMAHDLYVPYRFVLSVPERGGDRPVRGKEVVLTVSAAQLDSQGWQRP
ncbi:MAG TPA: hypothetical protein VFG86_12955 [Chloroflexota bacterium]|nr:hypothetical protein [Chloroflexota bacterium]